MCINNNTELLPYYQKAKESLDYDPLRGLFVWIDGRNRNKKGYLAGKVHNTGYEIIGVSIGLKKRKVLKSHRIAWFITHGYLPSTIDHIDGNKLNNKIANLRECTNSQNGMNKGISIQNTSGVKGVSWNSRDSVWQVRIGLNGKKIWVGSFKQLHEAEKAYKDKAKDLFGEFYRE